MNDYCITTHCWGQNNTFENTQAGKVFTGASKITTILNVSISDCLPFCSSIACADLYKVQFPHPPHIDLWPVDGWKDYSMLECWILKHMLKVFLLFVAIVDLFLMKNGNKMKRK